MTVQIKQNTAIWVPIVLLDGSGNPVTGLTFPTIYINKQGSSNYYQKIMGVNISNVAPNWNQVDSTNAPGLYNLLLDGYDTNTPGWLKVSVYTGAIYRLFTFTIVQSTKEDIYYMENVIRKLTRNRTRVDTTSFTYNLYDEDNTGVISSYDLKDSNGSPSSTTIYEKTPKTTFDLTAPAATITYEKLRYTYPDSSTLIKWNFSERTGTYNSSGFGANVQLAGSGYGTAITYAPGIFDGAINCNNSSLVATSSNTVEPTSNGFSISAWVKLRTVDTGPSIICAKEYAPNVWNGFAAGTRPMSICFGIQSGLPYFAMSKTGYATSHLEAETTDVRGTIGAGEWTLVAVTYNGTNVIFYVNGTQLPSIGTSTGPSGYSGVSLTGTIDFTSHGRWFVAGAPNASSNYINGILDDIRVDNTVRAQPYYIAMYKNAFGYAP